MKSTYFHFPPLFLSLFTSRPAYTAMPRLQTRQSSCSTNSPKQGNNSLYTKISSRENIHPLQPKTSKHLYTPSSQSSHRYQLLDELFITSTNQHLSGELTGREFLGDSIDIFCFALGETCCTQCRDIFGENLGGGRKRRVCLREESSKLCTN
jgi:hypothetical protein